MTWQERDEWFNDRIGKRVFRNDLGECCKTCKDVYENGVVIYDKQHAGYLHDVEGSAAKDDYSLKYFDTKKEVLEFEKEHPYKPENK